MLLNSIVALASNYSFQYSIPPTLDNPYYRYMRPAKKGDTISIVAECLKVGKTLAFVNVDILNKSDGAKIVAQGRHTKLL